MRRGRPGGPCRGLLEAVDSNGKVVGCTHGPDPAPRGIDATKIARPLRAKTITKLPCFGDGISGYRVQPVYVRASDMNNITDYYTLFKSDFSRYAKQTDDIFNKSAALTGGIRHIRFVTDSNCNLVVEKAIVSPRGDDSLANMVSELKRQGYNRKDRIYLLWVAAKENAICGKAFTDLDDRKSGELNDNNFGPGYARVDIGCWNKGGEVEAHELMHAMGAVQASAPHSTYAITQKQNHCTDEYDLMCYADSPEVQSKMTTVCLGGIDDYRFDCNHDDYFNTNPSPGSKYYNEYLDTHWNTANSKFLATTNGNAPLLAVQKKSTSPYVGKPCTNRAKLKGTCQDKNIAGSCSGYFEPGYCPGGKNIQCCVAIPCTTEYANVKGTCRDRRIKGSCSKGRFYPGKYCPGDNNIQCCVSR